MLASSDDWIWDSWLADDGERYHLFFLCAPRSLGDPGLRHRHARVGHAVSQDLRGWERVEDALDVSVEGATSTWTGSVVRDDAGRWHMLLTSARWVEAPATDALAAAHGVAQTVVRATSDDGGLLRWSRAVEPVLEPDPRWYETFSRESWPVHAWRDPWVVRDPRGEGWHALITARVGHGPAEQRGVVGHAWSPDLLTWSAAAPLSEPGSGFGQLEVCQVEQVEGRWVLVFSCLGDQVFGAQRERHGDDVGVWAVEAPGPLGPFDVAAAQPVTGADLYVGRLVREREGRWVMLAFDNATDGFGGTITDPVPVGWEGDRLVLRST